MSRITRRHISFAFVVVFVFVAVLVPAAIAGNGGVQPTSPWYAYDAALRKAEKQRHVQSAGIRIITDTLGGSGSAPVRTPQAKVVTGGLGGSAIPNKAQ